MFSKDNFTGAEEEPTLAWRYSEGSFSRRDRFSDGGG